MSKGVIAKFYEAKCGTCNNTDAISNKSLKDAIIIFKEEGWIKTTKHGWICSECNTKRLRYL